MDAGLLLFDREPLFGENKTWRGIAAAVAGCMVIALLLGQDWYVGVLFGAYAMLGDLLSSFIKRRFRIAPSGRATGLDQIPEALLPLWMLQKELSLTSPDIVMVVVAFFILEHVLSRILYRWHIRNRPY